MASILVSSVGVNTWGLGRALQLEEWR